MPEDEQSVICSPLLNQDSDGIGFDHRDDDINLLDDLDDDDSQLLLITGDSGGLAASYSILNKWHEHQHLLPK